jgi:23S rRNA pseudouridine2457 synthase
VEREITQESIDRLKDGIDILVKKKGLYRTAACEVRSAKKPDDLPERANPFTEYIPHVWLEFVLMEGKNRQIRKMCSAVRHECKRLIRTRIEDLQLGSMQPGEIKEMNQADLFRLLKLEPA